MKEKLIKTMNGKQDWRKKSMKQIDFIQDLFVLTSNYDGDGNGLCGESYEEVVSILEKEYPALFEGYKILKEVEENGKMR